MKKLPFAGAVVLAGLVSVGGAAHAEGAYPPNTTVPSPTGTTVPGWPGTTVPGEAVNTVAIDGLSCSYDDLVVPTGATASVYYTSKVQGVRLEAFTVDTEELYVAFNQPTAGEYQESISWDGKSAVMARLIGPGGTFVLTDVIPGCPLPGREDPNDPQNGSTTTSTTIAGSATTSTSVGSSGAAPYTTVALEKPNKTLPKTGLGAEIVVLGGALLMLGALLVRLTRHSDLIDHTESTS